MSVDRFARWNCDRCGLTLEKLPPEQPASWIGLVRFDPPESSEPNTHRFHLCGECADGFAVFMAGVQAPVRAAR
jgi:ribosomal protein S27AE